MANATIIYAGTQQGLAIVNRPGTLPEWLPPRMVLDGTDVQSVWASPGPPIRVLAVAGGQLLLSDSGGRSWEPARTGTEAACTGIFEGGGADPDLAVLYAGMMGGVMVVSRDGGASWQTLPPVAPPAMAEGGGVALRAALALVAAPDAGRQGIFYLLAEVESGTRAVLIGVPERGEWRVVLDGDVRAIACDTGTGYIYAATGEGVQVSMDAGASWHVLPGSPVAGQCMVAVPGPPGRPPSLVVGVPEGLRVSHDGGNNWQIVELPRPSTVVALTRDPERRDRLYAATDESFLFESGNRGREWKQVNARPLPLVRCLYAIRF